MLLLDSMKEYLGLKAVSLGKESHRGKCIIAYGSVMAAFQVAGRTE